MIPRHVRYALWCDAVALSLARFRFERAFLPVVPLPGAEAPLPAWAFPAAAALAPAAPPEAARSDDWLAAYA